MSEQTREIECISITEQISYIKASDNPLSADVILVDGKDYLYVFDVGNNEAVADYLNSIPKKKRVILSHFHTDHIGNIGRVDFESVYFGANTEKYFQHYIHGYAMQRFTELPGALELAFGGGQTFQRYVTAFEPIKIMDGVCIEIHPVPNSHAKGSLLMQVDGACIFIGDSLYSKVEGNYFVYNAQLLKEEIELLKRLPAAQIFSSHEERPVKAKTAVVRFLEQIYEKREKDSPYIYVAR